MGEGKKSRLFSWTSGRRLLGKISLNRWYWVIDSLHFSQRAGTSRDWAMCWFQSRDEQSQERLQTYTETIPIICVVAAIICLEDFRLANNAARLTRHDELKRSSSIRGESPTAGTVDKCWHTCSPVSETNVLALSKITLGQDDPTVMHASL